MPIYEYWCPTCQKEFELMRPMSEYNKAATCPICGTESEKLVSTFASKEGYAIKVPTGQPFRQRGQAPAATGPATSN